MRALLPTAQPSAPRLPPVGGAALLVMQTYRETASGLVVPPATLVVHTLAHALAAEKST